MEGGWAACRAMTLAGVEAKFVRLLLMLVCVGSVRARIKAMKCVYMLDKQDWAVATLLA